MTREEIEDIKRWAMAGGVKTADGVQTPVEEAPDESVEVVKKVKRVRDPNLPAGKRMPKIYTGERAATKKDCKACLQPIGNRRLFQQMHDECRTEWKRRVKADYMRTNSHKWESRRRAREKKQEIARRAKEEKAKLCK